MPARERRAVERAFLMRHHGAVGRVATVVAGIVGFSGWTFCVGTWAGVFTMSVAHSDKWQVGYSVILGGLGIVWLGAPTLLFFVMRQSRQRRVT
jgi:hypothetical protein